MAVDLLGSDETDEAHESTADPPDDRVSRSPARRRIDAVLTIENLDRLAVGAHDDAVRGHVNGKESHAPSVVRASGGEADAERVRVGRGARHAVAVADPYFNERMINRQRLAWAVATRRQLERWEPIVAAVIRRSFAGLPPEGPDVWAAEMERHFALVAACNLLRALDLAPTSVSVDPTLRAELIDGRNLLEHWAENENMAVFNVQPRVAEPRRSAKSFAERNPGRRPYFPLLWNSKTGAQLMPNVSAPALHELLDAAEAEVVSKDAALSRYVPARAPSPWIHQDGEWWPTPERASS
jgi:hypothetical protein